LSSLWRLHGSTVTIKATSKATKEMTMFTFIKKISRKTAGLRQQALPENTAATQKTDWNSALGAGLLACGGAMGALNPYGWSGPIVRSRGRR
jgi:hypothetical protein